ncbi:MAG: T9SS type A sorting domain-containing protein [Bacteroidia bacterium]|nr:T9SS type A sorting domain-containing protein [Bacteroidia bacterium]
MKRIFIIYYLLLIVLYSKSQNLVPNGDFETYSSCPNGPAQTNLATPWYDPTGATSDYYNSCATALSGIGVPFQSNGAVTLFQPAFSGNAYMGLFASQNNASDYREYIQVKLSDTLSFGQCYLVTFNINLMNLLKKGCNNVGAYLSTTAISTTAPNVLNYTPQILMSGNSAITDTVNWIKISGIYTALGGEEYLTIGNFQNDSNTTFQIADTANPFDGCYYYIDDVSVINCNDTLSSVSEIENQYDFQLYPNPNNGSFTVEYAIEENDQADLCVYSVEGKKIACYKLNANDKKILIQENLFSNGMYFYQIHLNGKIAMQDKLIIIK